MGSKGWQNGNMNGIFDISCQYRVKINDGNNDVYFYFDLVKPHILHGSSNHAEDNVNIHQDAVWIKYNNI